MEYVGEPIKGDQAAAQELHTAWRDRRHRAGGKRGGKFVVGCMGSKCKLHSASDTVIKHSEHVVGEFTGIKYRTTVESGRKGAGLIACTASWVVCVATCLGCGAQYVGCTTDQLNRRFNGHRMDRRKVMGGEEHTGSGSKYFAEHFDGRCTGSKVQVQVIEHIVGQSRDDEVGHGQRKEVLRARESA